MEMAKHIASSLSVGMFCWLMSISVLYAQQAMVVRGGTLIDGNGGEPLECIPSGLVGQIEGNC